MKRLLASLAFAGFLVSPALADGTIDTLSVGAALAGTESVPMFQTANPAVRTTTGAIGNAGALTGDVTKSAGSGVTTLKNTGPGATGPIGSATVSPIVTIDAQGRVTALSSASITQPSGANPTGTAGPTAVNGVATTFMRSDGAPAVQQGSSSQKGIVQVDGTTITASSGVISAAPISAVPSVQSGTNYAIVDGDRAKVIYLSNASAQTPTLPSAATLTNSNGWFVTVCNINAGIQTLTPTTSTIGGAASLAIPGGSAARPVCWNAVSDGTNYSLVPAGNTNFIATGTLAMGTSAVSAGTCGTAATLSAPGVVTTDRITVGFNGDPTATTGYLPTAMLTLVPYPTANNINIKQCNLTGSSITPAALTVNVQVSR